MSAPPPGSDVDIRRARASSPKMSNGASDRVEETPPPNADNERSAPKPEVNEKDQIPTPPRSNNSPEDYSDIASADSQLSTSQRRRNQRGGRKKKSEQLQSASEFEIPRGQTQEHDAQAESEWKDGNSEGNDYDAEELKKARSSRHASAKKRPPSTTPKAGSGIRAFNLKRAESSRGGRPIRVTVERPKPKSKAKKKKKEKSEQESEESGEEDEIEEEEEETEKKSVSIRFDLNLEVEIVLKAKIKGDVTVTFL